MSTTIESQLFGKLEDGTEVMLYTLANGQGLEVSVSNLGGIITSLRCPDRNGRMDDIVLGFDEPQPYLHSPYIGATIGRYCNRIANGCFILDGETFNLEVNENGHQLHGGPLGFDKKLWEVSVQDIQGQTALVLELISEDGEQGFPGKVRAQVSFILSADNALHLQYHATTDKLTHINMTHHDYFNLQGNGNILDHQLSIDADTFTPVDASLIPSGELINVTGTPLDFRQPKNIGDDIEADEVQIVRAGGYDHNYVLNKSSSNTLTKAAQVWEPKSGRIMTLDTTEPGLQFYSGNFLNSNMVGKGRAFEAHAAFCLEPQHFPDSPNQPTFPSTVLRPEEHYRSESIYSFFTD